MEILLALLSSIIVFLFETYFNDFIMIQTKSVFLGILSFFILLTAQAQMTRKQYIAQFKDVAINEMHRSGIPASITLAQGCLESSNGNSELTRRSNNHFGIKCQSGWNGRSVRYDDDEKNECFRKYRNAEASYIDHSEFLMNNFRYAILFKLDQDDYKGWARGLKKAGYATNPDYAKMLIKIIEDEELYKYDNDKSGQYRRNSLFVFGKEKLRLEQQKEVDAKNSGEEIVEKDESWITYDEVNAADREVFEFNGLQAVEVKADDTFEAIAESVGKKVWEIKHYNDLPYSVEKPQVTSFLYVQLKRFKSVKGATTHTVQAGESLWSISQEYGIRLGALKRKNKLKDGHQIQVGDILYLRTRK